MTLRPVTPGHVAVRPRPTALRPGAWCIVTVGPVKHYKRAVEVDGNPADPQVFLHAYEFVSRDIALYAARLILRNGWLHTCDEPYPDDLTEAQKNRCIHPLGHEGMHGNGYYRWTPGNWVPTDYAGVLPIEFERGELEMWPEDMHSWLSEARPVQDRCTSTDAPFGAGVQCQLPLGHSSQYHHYEDNYGRTRWLNLDRNPTL